MANEKGKAGRDKTGLINPENISHKREEKTAAELSKLSSKGNPSGEGWGNYLNKANSAMPGNLATEYISDKNNEPQPEIKKGTAVIAIEKKMKELENMPKTEMPGKEPEKQKDKNKERDNEKNMPR